MHDAPILPLIAIAVSLTTIIIFFMTFSLLMLVKRQNRKSKQLMQALLEEKENTMRSISMEIHDNVNQMLNVAAIQLHLIEERVHPDTLPLIREVGRIVDTLSFDTQNISHVLNPDYVRDIGLITSLMEIANWLNASDRIRCDIAVDGERKAIPEQTGLMVFRIAQETLNNIIKYAHADTVNIHLYFGKRDFRMSIADNGKGIDLNAESYKKGSGMSNLRQRAKIVAGSINISSSPGSGTTVLLSIPNAFNIED